MMKRILLIIIVVFLFNACGSKGDLTLEPSALPLKINNIIINQRGENFLLKFGFPPLLSDNSSFDFNKVTRVHVYHSTKEIPNEKFRKKSSLILKIKNPLNIITKEGEKYIITIPFKIKNLDNVKHYFGILYYLKRKRAPMSKIVSLTSQIPHKSLKDVKIDLENKTIILEWTKSKLNLSGKKIKQIAGYNVYRKIVGEKIDKEKDVNAENKEEPIIEYFVKLNNEFIKDNFYEDKDLKVEGMYFYRITSAYNNNIESAFSNTVSIEYKDTYPPEKVEDLFVVKGNGYLFLNWESVKDGDFSHYLIFRRDAGKSSFVKIADDVITPRYKDKNVKKGKVYLYFVVAVDEKGNESDRSGIVKERY